MTTGHAQTQQHIHIPTAHLQSEHCAHVHHCSYKPRRSSSEAHTFRQRSVWYMYCGVCKLCTVKANATGKTAQQCTAVECATCMLRVHVDNSEEESCSAMAEEVMFDAVVWRNGGLSHANFFRFEHLMLVLAYGYSFETLAWSRKAFPGRPTWGERKANFSSTFWEAALLLDGLLRDMDSRNHAIHPVLLAKYQSFIPLPSWCTTDDMTDR